eukprot:gene12063-16093_t
MSHPDRISGWRGSADVAARRPSAIKAPPAAATQNGYTIAHAGKQIRIGPVLFWIVIGAVIALGTWSAATATYFAFRDDVLTRLIARQAEMQYAYEDRIAELRTEAASKAGKDSVAIVVLGG